MAKAKAKRKTKVRFRHYVAQTTDGTRHLTPQQKREVQALAGCDTRTLRNWIHGRDMKPTTKERIDRAWAEVRQR